MEIITNCKNCGAPLHYDKSDYGAMSKCQYCGTEYHIDLLGRIEEYIIKIEFMGEVRQYYIGDWEMIPMYPNTYHDISGRLQPGRAIYKSKLKLIEL